MPPRKAVATKPLLPDTIKTGVVTRDHSVIAYRSIGTMRFSKTLELPIEPAIGQLVALEPGRAVAIKTVEVRPLKNPWAPGFKVPAVSVVLYEEPGAEVERAHAIEEGWETVAVSRASAVDA